jgi:hypothetical protein
MGLLELEREFRVIFSKNLMQTIMHPLPVFSTLLLVWIWI